MEALSELLAELPDRLRDEADAVVADARDTDDLVERLAALDERHGIVERTNKAVSNASSVADLRAELGSAGEFGGTDTELAASEDDDVFGRIRSTFDGVRDRVTGDDADADPSAPAGIEGSSQPPADTQSTSVPVLGRARLPSVGGSRSRNIVRAARERAGAGALELRRTLRDADPKQAALWGLATGATVANPAIAASYSTAALLSGAVLSGGAVGAYASSHDDTVFDDVNPLLMAQRANAGASTGSGARNINGESVGGMLGASAYLAETLAPTEYAQWIANVDAESVLRGAEMGAERATTSDDFESTRSGAALGGGLGLLYGMAADDHDDGDPLQGLLDDDLWDEYADRLKGDESATKEDD